VENKKYAMFLFLTSFANLYHLFFDIVFVYPYTFFFNWCSGLQEDMCLGYREISSNNAFM